MFKKMFYKKILNLNFKFLNFYIRLIAHPFFYPPHHMTSPFQHHDGNASNQTQTQDLLPKGQP
jgi:hypothetical protein